jgi:cytochrome-b5 reductase
MDPGATVYDQFAQLLSENQHLAIGLGVALLVVVATKLAVSAGRPRQNGVLSADEYQRFPLIEKTIVSHNTRLFRFGLPSEFARLGLPLGRHISLRAFIGDEETRRPYTPITSDNEVGHFDLLIKVYPEPHGKMSRHLDSLSIGETVDVRGPLGKFTYKRNSYAKLCMVCGGTGITPMWQVFREILADEDDTTEIVLVFANVTEDDILLRSELLGIEKSNPRFSAYYVLNNPPASWTGGSGFVSEQMLREKFGAPTRDTLVLICGPPPMNKAMKAHLSAIGFSDEQVFKF